jgi:hypothetical protein
MKNIYFNINSGDISIDENIIAGRFIKLNDVKKMAVQIGAVEKFFPMSNMHSLFFMPCKFIELAFSMSVGFKENNCVSVAFHWQDGASSLLGYETSYEDAAKEKKLLVTLLTNHFGRASDLNKKLTSTWHFSWGDVGVSQNAIHSNSCYTYIKYATE